MVLFNSLFDIKVYKMDEDMFQCTPPDILESARAATEKLLPTKSSTIYEVAYKKFIKWCAEKNVSNYSENVLLAYFSEMAKKKVKSSTMWSQYSMVKSLLNIRNGVDITKYLKLRAYLKKQNEGYTPKKARVLTKEQFDKFLSDAPNEKYLATKVSS